MGIVVDRMRTDYIYQYWDNFDEGGFKRLIGEGSFLRDALQLHAHCDGSWPREHLYRYHT
ncbi:MAG: hypothetical protein IPH53_22965 [Flavobacteriales bacterium]|nr:hypothetical protein [Flavobacteriales bacterium]